MVRFNRFKNGTYEVSTFNTPRKAN